jgi:hypothetical protein
MVDKKQIKFLKFIRDTYGKECKEHYIRLSKNSKKDPQDILDMALAETFPGQLKTSITKKIQ